MDRPIGCNGQNGPAAGRPLLRLVASNGAHVAQTDATPAPVKAAPLVLPAKASLSDAIAAILSACLDHFEANAPALRATGDPEAVHQLRVALRRLRAFLGLLKPRTPCPELASAAARAKTIASALGPAREWHVFREGLEGRPRELLLGDPSFPALLEAVELRRIGAQEVARAEIDAPETQAFLSDMRGLVSRRGFGESALGKSALGKSALEWEKKDSARAFAVKELDRLHRRALKRCEGVEKMSPEPRHQARIALKKIRYGAEFFESLFCAKGARGYLRAIAEIQDRLGEDNDRATSVRLLQEIAEADAASWEMTRAVCFLSGYVQAQAFDAAAAKTCERRLRRLEPFWR